MRTPMSKRWSLALLTPAAGGTRLESAAPASVLSATRAAARCGSRA